MAMIRMEQVHGMSAIPTTRLKGGYQMVRYKKNLEGIGEDNRVEGMRVYCLEDKTLYILVDDGAGNLVFKPSTEVEEVTEGEVRTLFDIVEKIAHDPKNTPPEPKPKDTPGVTGAVYWDDVQDKPDVFPAAMHNHDDRYIKISDAAIQSPYDIAVKHGYEGTEEEWLDSIKGVTPSIRIGNVTEGETANVVNVGTKTNLVLDFTMPAPKIVKGAQGDRGKSAYEVAVDNGFKGTEAEWVYSMVGHDGKSPTIRIGSVTTGEIPSVKNSGTALDPILDFVLPAAEKLERTVVDLTIAPDDWKSGVYTVSNTAIKSNSIVEVRTPEVATADEFTAFTAANIHYKYCGEGKGELHALGTVPTTQMKLQIVIL